RFISNPIRRRRPVGRSSRLVRLRMVSTRPEVTGLVPAFRLLKPSLQIFVFLYWGALCMIHVRNAGNRTRLPIDTGSKNRDPGMFTLCRIILGAAFFAAPLLLLREWLGL